MTLTTEQVMLDATWITFADLNWVAALTGTAGEKLATSYVASYMASLGLEPAGSNGTYFHSFPFTAGVEFEDRNALTSGDKAFDAQYGLEAIGLLQFRNDRSDRSGFRWLRNRRSKRSRAAGIRFLRALGC